MEELLSGLQLTDGITRELRFLQNADTAVRLSVLLDVHFKCKLCHDSDAQNIQNWDSVSLLQDHLTESHGFPLDQTSTGKSLLSTHNGVSDDAKSDAPAPKCANSKRQLNFGSRNEDSEIFLIQDSRNQFASCHRVREAESLSEGEAEFTEDHELISFEASESYQDNDIENSNHGNHYKEEALQQGSHEVVSASVDPGWISKAKPVSLMRTKVKQANVTIEIESDESVFEVCEKYLTPKNKLLRTEKVKTCPECSEVKESTEACIQHYLDRHDSTGKMAPLTVFLAGKCALSLKEKDNVACPLCGKRFRHSTLLKHAVLIHMWRPMQKRLLRKKQHLCAECGKIFQHDQNYYHHMATVHHGRKNRPSPYKAKQYHCTVSSTCDFVTCEQRRLASHIKFVHSGIKTYSCQHCSYSTWERTSMRDHMYRHKEEKRYSCHLCKYQCIQRKQLRGHLKHKHSVDLPKTGTTKSASKPCPRQPQIAKSTSLTVSTDRAVATEPMKSRKRSTKAKDNGKRKKVSLNLQTANRGSTSRTSANVTDDQAGWAMAPIVPQDGKLLQQQSMSYIINPPFVQAADLTMYPMADQHQQETTPGSVSGTLLQVSGQGSEQNVTCGSSYMSDVMVLPLESSGTENSSIVMSQPLMDNNSILMEYNSSAMTPPKTNYQLVQVKEQPGGKVGATSSITHPNTIPNSPVNISTIKLQTPQGGTIAVTPMYAQTSETGNTLNPTNTQGSFVYILK